MVGNKGSAFPELQVTSHSRLIIPDHESLLSNFSGGGVHDSYNAPPLKKIVCYAMRHPD